MRCCGHTSQTFLTSVISVSSVVYPSHSTFDKKALTVSGMGDKADNLPPQNQILWKWFRWYARRYVAKHFHAVRELRGAGLPDAARIGDRPIVIYQNHPSWWDPMISIVVADQVWPDRRHHAPIDEAMLEAYGIFRPLGFFGVDQADPRRGGVQFLRKGEAVASRDRTCLWVPAEGTFTDVRKRPVVLRAGLAHLAARLERAVVIPLAVEYTFWAERTPEALLAWGEPTFLDTLTLADRETDALQNHFENHLSDALDRLAAAAVSRDESRFVAIHGGEAGTAGVWGWWQRMTGKSRTHGEAMRTGKRGGA